MNPIATLFISLTKNEIQK